MVGFDMFPVAAASLDMTAALAPLLLGLCGLVGLSAVGIVVSARAAWIVNPRQTAARPPVTASSDLAPQEWAKAA
jgi:hypothetical protein